MCGDYLEAHIFPVYRKSISRRKKSKPSRECQQKLNDISAENKCIRIVHANFSYKDMKIDLTYDNAHVPMVKAFKEALGQMKIELDDEVAGKFIERTVTRAIYS